MRKGEERSKKEVTEEENGISKELNVVAGVERGGGKKEVTEEKSGIANEFQVVAGVEKRGGKEEVTEEEVTEEESSIAEEMIVIEGIARGGKDEVNEESERALGVVGRGNESVEGEDIEKEIGRKALERDFEE